MGRLMPYSRSGFIGLVAAMSVAEICITNRISPASSVTSTRQSSSTQICPAWSFSSSPDEPGKLDPKLREIVTIDLDRVRDRRPVT